MYAEVRLNLVKNLREQAKESKCKAEGLLLKTRLLEATEIDVIEEITDKLNKIRNKVKGE